MKDQVLALLQQVCPDIDFNSGAELITDGILDSLSIITIIGTLTMEFNITIPYEEIVEENFNSVDAISALVERLL